MFGIVENFVAALHAGTRGILSGIFIILVVPVPRRFLGGGAARFFYGTDLFLLLAEVISGVERFAHAPRGTRTTIRCRFSDDKMFFSKKPTNDDCATFQSRRITEECRVRMTMYFISAEQFLSSIQTPTPNRNDL